MQKQRKEYKEKMRQLDGNNLVFVDESGIVLGERNGYARSSKGERAYTSSGYQKGSRLNIIGALGANEVISSMTIEGSVNGEVFLQYIKECLVPKLKKGQVVIMDNLQVHKVIGVKEAIEAAEAELMYLPPYSPELSPIEECWSKVKNLIRKKTHRTPNHLHTAIKKSFEKGSQQDIFGWFIHPDYVVN